MQNNINGEELRSLLIALRLPEMHNEIMRHVESGCEKIHKEQKAGAQIAGEVEREVQRLILGTEEV